MKRNQMSNCTGLMCDNESINGCLYCLSCYKKDYDSNLEEVVIDLAVGASKLEKELEVANEFIKSIKSIYLGTLIGLDNFEPDPRDLEKTSNGLSKALVRHHSSILKMDEHTVVIARIEISKNVTDGSEGTIVHFHDDSCEVEFIIDGKSFVETVLNWKIRRKCDDEKD